MRPSDTELQSIDAAQVAAWLPRRQSDGHKASYGRLHVVAGSCRYPGAAVLVGLGAFKAGCGYVSIETSAPLSEILKALPELVPTRPDLFDAVVYGPGLSDEGPPLQEVLGWKCPLVIDGSGLDHLPPGPFPEDCVLTPHPGEAARLLGRETAWVQTHRAQALEDLASRLPGSSAVLLKGEHPLVAFKGHRYLIPTGNAGQSTAGQGDVLSGIIGAYLAAGLESGPALLAAAYLHGAAGDVLAARAGLAQGVLAHEVANELPHTVARLLAKI